MGNPFCHVELWAHDLPTAKTFYSSIFNWKLTEEPQFRYVMVDVGEGTGGGMQESQDKTIPTHWLPYVLVSDIKAYTMKAKELGATILLDCMVIPEMGWITIFTDPQGASLGMFQSAVCEEA